MVQYFDNYETACFDGYSFRLDKKTGYYLSTKVIGKRRKRLHVYVYEKCVGKIPKGMHVHHKDEDKRNNTPENLVLLTASEHAKLHGSELTEEQLQKKQINITTNAMPMAKKWHSTPEGMKWHSEHAKETMKKRVLISYQCTQCGKTFETKHIYGKGENAFCSNNCKSMFRRKSGVDNEERSCEKCGAIFTANKYSKAKYCEKHRHKNR